MAYNYETRYNSPNYTPASQSKAVFGQNRVVKGITIHWWGDPKNNPSYEGVRDYLCRNAGNTSAHLVVTGTGRRAACIVDYTDVAWHSGNAVGNATTIGIECDPRCRDEDYDVIAEVVADIRSAFGDVPIYSHSMWTNTACPGNYDIERIDKLSYTKYSAAEWGKGGNKVTKTPPTPAVEPPKAPKPEKPTTGNTGNTSPTTNGSDGEPLIDTGKPVAEKIDYKQVNVLLTLLKLLIEKILNIFK